MGTDRRKKLFPPEIFLEGATLASALPGAAVFAAHGRAREAGLLCGGLLLWLAVARLWPAPDKTKQ